MTIGWHPQQPIRCLDVGVHHSVLHPQNRPIWQRPSHKLTLLTRRESRQGGPNFAGNFAGFDIFCENDLSPASHAWDELIRFTFYSKQEFNKNENIQDSVSSFV